MKRITIFTGHFGSGKTEVAINYALNAGRGTVIVDLDIVNPYFRTNDVKSKLQELGISVIAPQFASTNVDIPALSSEINSIFVQDKNVVIDSGGDDDGAVALGRYYHFFKKELYDMFFVINTKRPMTSYKEGIIEMIKAVESASRLKITGLVNNTNLMHETSIEDILKGGELIKEVSEATGVPLVLTCARRDLAQKLGEGAFGLDLYLQLPFGGGIDG